MPLPDIGLQTWLEDQQKRFYEATSGMFPALDFELGTRQTESEIPSDYDAPGGMDQWRELEQQRIEDESRRAQQEDEQRRQQEIQAQAEQYRLQQQEAEEAARQQRIEQEQGVMEQIRSLGIPTPGDVFSMFRGEQIGDSSSTTGVFDVSAPTGSQSYPGGPYPSVPPGESPTGSSDTSLLDKFNTFASGLNESVFGSSPSTGPEGEAPQDNLSTTGAFESLGSAARSVGETLADIPSRLGSAVDQGFTALGEQVGPKIERDRQRLTGLVESVLPQTGIVEGVSGLLEREGKPISSRQPAGTAFVESVRETGEPVLRPLQEAGQSAVRGIEDFLGARPGTLYQAAQDVSGVLGPEAAILGAVRRGGQGFGGLGDDLIRSVQGLLRGGLEEEALAVERGIAQKSRLTLEEVQQQTRGVPPPSPAVSIGNFDEPMPGGALTPEEQALNAAADVRARAAPPHSGYIEDPTFDAEPPSAVQGARPAPPNSPPGRQMEFPEQPMLPGFEDLRSTQRVNEPPEPGFGTLPRSTDPVVPGSMTRDQEDVLRGINQQLFWEERPLTAAERMRAVADAIDEDPGVVARKVSEAQNVDPRQAGVTQEMLKQNVRYQLDRFETARQTWLATKREVDEIMSQPGAKTSDVPDDLAAKAAADQLELADVLNDLTLGIKGQSLTAKAASRTMSAQKSGYMGAYAVRKANVLEDVAKGAKQGAAAVQDAQKHAGPVSRSVKETLRKAKTKLEGKSGRRALTEGGPTPSGRGGGGRRGSATSSTSSPPPRQPKSETLAERLGWLDREWRQLRLANASDEEFARNHAEFQEAIRQAQVQVRTAARQKNITEANLAPLHRDEEQRLINEALGRRYISDLKKQAELDAPKLSPQTDRSIMREMNKHYHDQEKLAASIDAQMQRRIDGALATEQRAAVREELRNMAKAAQINARALLRDPESLTKSSGQHNEEQFDLMLRKMREHSNVGKRLADEMEDRLWNQLGRRMTQQEEQGYRAGQRAISEARIRAVVQQIDDVLDNKIGPDRADQLNQLYADLSEISVTGAKRASDTRRQAYEAGLLQSGLFAKDADTKSLIEMMSAIDPSDPKSFRAIREIMKRPSVWQLWREISFVNLLSSPMTHAKNMTSTMQNMGLWMLRQPLEQILSGGELSGTGAMFKGLRAGVKPGARAAAQTMKTGLNPEKLENVLAQGDFRHIGREILPEAMEESWGKVGAGKIGRRFGEAMHWMATRPLEAGDAFLGNMARSAALYQGAQRKADRLLREGKLPAEFQFRPDLEGDQRNQLASHILNTIWDHTDVLEGAGKAENYMLFRTSDPDFIENGLRFFMRQKDFAPDDPITKKLWAWTLDFLMPFYQVPYNYTKQGLGNVVGGPVDFIRAGNAAIKRDKSAQGRHAAKAIQGGLMLGMPMLLASQDMLTGTGPPDPGDRRVWLETHQPNSVRLPGTNEWLSYEGTPWAIPFSMIANGKEAMEFTRKKPGQTDSEVFWQGMLHGARGIAKGAMSQSLIEGLTRNFEFLTGQFEGPQDIATGVSGAISRYSPHTLLAPVPSAMMNFLADLSDTVERDTGRARNFDDIGPIVQTQIEGKIPGLRQELPEKRGGFGEIIENPQFGGRGLIPGYKGRPPMAGDPISEQLQRGSVGIPNAPTEITVGQGSIPITMAEQALFQRVYGQEYRKLLEEYNAGTETKLDIELINLREAARKAARAAVLDTMTNTDIDRRWVARPIQEIAP